MSRVTLVLLNWLGLLVSSAIGICAGVLIKRHLQRREPGSEDGQSASGMFTDALAYVSGVLGIMLGLMLFFSVQVYEEVRQSAREEAVALADVFESADFFPATGGNVVRRDTICLMRSVATDSWTSAESGDLTGDENTAAWAATVRSSIAELPTGGPTRQEAQAQMMTAFQDAQNARQKRILSSVFDLPLIVWIIIDLGVLVFAALMVVSLPDRPRTALVLIGACLVFTMGVVGALSMFATPFTHLGVSVKPDDIHGALVRLQDIYPQADWSPCARLAQSEFG
ncbi:MAG: hypothetical protein V9G10_05805 [Candidatus Nanopelagicales bacterium]